MGPPGTGRPSRGSRAALPGRDTTSGTGLRSPLAPEHRLAQRICHDQRFGAPDTEALRATGTHTTPNEPWLVGAALSVDADGLETTRPMGIDTAPLTWQSGGDQDDEGPTVEFDMRATVPRDGAERTVEFEVTGPMEHVPPVRESPIEEPTAAVEIADAPKAREHLPHARIAQELFERALNFFLQNPDRAQAAFHVDLDSGWIFSTDQVYRNVNPLRSRGFLYVIVENNQGQLRLWPDSQTDLHKDEHQLAMDASTKELVSTIVTESALWAPRLPLTHEDYGDDLDDEKAVMFAFDVNGGIVFYENGPSDRELGVSPSEAMDLRGIAEALGAVSDGAAEPTAAIEIRVEEDRVRLAEGNAPMVRHEFQPHNANWRRRVSWQEGMPPVLNRVRKILKGPRFASLEFIGCIDRKGRKPRSTPWRANFVIIRHSDTNIYELRLAPRWWIGQKLYEAGVKHAQLSDGQSVIWAGSMMAEFDEKQRRITTLYFDADSGGYGARVMRNHRGHADEEGANRRYQEIVRLAKDIITRAMGLEQSTVVIHPRHAARQLPLSSPWS
jgi:hypothetical protein